MAELGTNGETAALNVSQAAEFLGVHTETVRRLARKGELPAFKVGRQWRVKRELFERWMEEQSMKNVVAPAETE